MCWFVTVPFKEKVPVKIFSGELELQHVPLDLHINWIKTSNGNSVCNSVGAGEGHLGPSHGLPAFTSARDAKSCSFQKMSLRIRLLERDPGHTKRQETAFLMKTAETLPPSTQGHNWWQKGPTSKVKGHLGRAPKWTEYLLITDTHSSLA